MKENRMDNRAAVIVPAKTVVQINGIPCALAVDTIVETAYGNMQHLTGHHYASLPASPDGVPDGVVASSADPQETPQ